MPTTTPPVPFTPKLGETYFATFNDNGILKPRRYQWTNHPLDSLHLANKNCYHTLDEAQAAADIANLRNKGSIYRWCNLCGQHTAMDGDRCTACNTLMEHLKTV